MSEEDNFLSRWSRRKRAALESRQDPPSGDALPQSGDEADLHAGLQDDVAAAESPAKESRPKAPSARGGSPQSKNPAPFDLSKLPSIEAIGPQTDIRMFMQAGVPAALKRAALRQAWAADPAIRDYIGLSENSWDFTAPDSMAGFGALDPADAKEMVAQIFRQMTDDVQHGSESGTEELVAEDMSPASGLSPDQAPSKDTDTQRMGELPAKEAQVPDVTDARDSSPSSALMMPTHDATRSAAMQHHTNALAENSDVETVAFRKRTHGGALPQ
jgi:hypothetical protein